MTSLLSIVLEILLSMNYTIHFAPAVAILVGVVENIRHSSFLSVLFVFLLRCLSYFYIDILHIYLLVFLNDILG